MESGLTKQTIINTMTLSPHGDLSAYIPVLGQAAKSDQEFAAHFVSYLAAKSQVRDINVAAPIITLAEPKFRDQELIDNSLAHLAKLSPRELVQAYDFAKGYVRNPAVRYTCACGRTWETTPEPGTKVPALKCSCGSAKLVRPSRVGGIRKFMVGAEGLLAKSDRMNMLDRLVARYIHAREENAGWFERSVLQFRHDIQRLYFLSHTKPSAYAKEILYDRVRPAGSSLEVVTQLPNMNPMEAAAAILEYKLPFLIINSVLKGKARDPKIIMAMINRMSPSEVQTNLKMLESFGVKDHPETRAALEDALGRLAKSGKTTLKTTKALDAVKDEKLKERVRETQDRQLTSMKGIDGDWLVLGDKSPSMEKALETAKLVAGTLAKMVRGKVYLVFFDSFPLFFDVTGMSYDQIISETRRVEIGGGTSIGCGLQYILDRKLTVDGIAVISDAAENSEPRFVDRYQRYVNQMGNEPTVYLYRFQPTIRAQRDVDLAVAMKAANLDLQEFDLRAGVDFYSLPNLVGTMRIGRYSLLDEIRSYKLITLDSVLMDRKGELVAL